MRKVLLIASMVLLAVTFAVAQSSTTSTSSTASPANATDWTIQGCLSGSSGNYTLTNASGVTWQLQGNTDQLKDQVGHTVAINGNKPSPSSGCPCDTGENSNSTTASDSVFQVSSFEPVSSTCPNIIGANPNPNY
jgi:hypothetical protein